MTTKTTRQLISLANLETVTGGSAPIASPSERLSKAASFLETAPTMLGTAPEMGVMPCHLVETAPQEPSPSVDCCDCAPGDAGDDAPDLDANGDDMACDADAGDEGEGEPEIEDDGGFDCSDVAEGDEPADPACEPETGDDDGLECSDAGDQPEDADGVDGADETGDADDAEGLGCADASEDTSADDGVADDGLTACPPAQEAHGVADDHLEGASLVTATLEAVHPPCGTVTHAPTSRFGSELLSSMNQYVARN